MMMLMMMMYDDNDVDDDDDGDHHNDDHVDINTRRRVSPTWSYYYYWCSCDNGQQWIRIKLVWDYFRRWENNIYFCARWMEGWGCLWSSLQKMFGFCFEVCFQSKHTKQIAKCFLCNLVNAFGKTLWLCFVCDDVRSCAVDARGSHNPNYGWRKIDCPDEYIISSIAYHTAWWITICDHG